VNANTNIFIFRTNISSEAHRDELRSIFENMGVLDWSVDLEDCDRVLRVVCRTGEPDDYIREVVGRGFECEELQ
jgi:hypothetical protein